jgi:transcriptional regulator with XRE-family HTH domain
MLLRRFCHPLKCEDWLMASPVGNNIEPAPAEKPRAFDHFLLTLLQTDKLKIFGAAIGEARRRHGWTQAKLGRRLWADEDLSRTAAQTRIYRVEKGLQELDIETTRRLLDILTIDEFDARTLQQYAPQSDRHGHLIDHRAFDLYPDLYQYLELINANLQRDDIGQAIKIFRFAANYLLTHRPDEKTPFSHRAADQKKE